MASNELMITNGPTTNGPDTRGSDGRSLDGDAWRSESICRKHPTRWWFGGDQRETAVARGICATCGVQSACLEFAIGRPEMLGIWAATTPADRAAIRRARSAPPVETEPDAPATVAAIRVAGDNGVAIGDAVEVIAVDVAAAEVAGALLVSAGDISAAAIASAGDISAGDMALDLGAVLDLEAEHARRHRVPALGRRGFRGSFGARPGPGIGAASAAGRARRVAHSRRGGPQARCHAQHGDALVACGSDLRDPNHRRSSPVPPLRDRTGAARSESRPGRSRCSSYDPALTTRAVRRGEASTPRRRLRSRAGCVRTARSGNRRVSARSIRRARSDRAPTSLR